MRTKTPSQWKIPHGISPEPMAGLVTGLGGVAVAGRAFRGMHLPGACDANLGVLRQIAQGRTAGQVVETAVTGVMPGADNVEAIDRLREDAAVAKMPGYAPAGSRSIRDWLEKCHDEGVVRRAREEADELALKASVPAPTTGLRGLQTVPGIGAREAAARLPGGAPHVATVDPDATVVESAKRSACRAYTGVKGYQPVVAVWAESRVILATEFRDGNVPAAMDPLTCARPAFAELPDTVRTRGFRGDSACDNQELLDWLDDARRPGGPTGAILHAISARMAAEPAAAAKAVPDSGWTTFGKDSDGTLRQWAELDYVPGRKTECKNTQPRRYIGLRLLKPQGELFDDGHDRKHFAVVTNRTERAERVIEWHREKAGTVEHTHDDVKNALAGGRLPSQKFGANAAWFALNAPACNVMAGLRAAAVEPEERVARIKSLRFNLLLVSARLTRFSRKITLRFAGSRAWVDRMLRLLDAFPCRVQPTG